MSGYVIAKTHFFVGRNSADVFGFKLFTKPDFKEWLQRQEAFFEMGNYATIYASYNDEHEFEAFEDFDSGLTVEEISETTYTELMRAFPSGSYGNFASPYEDTVEREGIDEVLMP